MKCETCLYSRIVISENGYHRICALSDKKAIECIINDYKHYEIDWLKKYANMRGEKDE